MRQNRVGCCEVKRCVLPIFARRMCRSHYNRWHRRGDPLAARKPRGRRPLLDRLANKIRVGDGCWEWVGNRDRDGYGVLTDQNRSVRAHRVVYELMVAPITAGLVLDHLCENRSCVRPDHLEPVTSAENTRRAFTLRPYTA